jgi:hypothetical protein
MVFVPRRFVVFYVSVAPFPVDADHTQYPIFRSGRRQIGRAGVNFISLFFFVTDTLGK